jgi:hypothetical protein
MVVNILSKEKPLGMYHEGDEHPLRWFDEFDEKKKHHRIPQRSPTPIEYGAKQDGAPISSPPRRPILRRRYTARTPNQEKTQLLAREIVVRRSEASGNLELDNELPHE